MRALILLSVLLVGCIADNPPDVYRLEDKQAAFGTWCRARVQPYGVEFNKTDSTKACPDGSAPKLFETEYVSPNKNCSVTEVSDVVGGFAGIKRIWGCRK